VRFELQVAGRPQGIRARTSPSPGFSVKARAAEPPEADTWGVSKSFEAPATGPYIVRLFAFPSTPDSSIRFAGGSAFVYRLTLTTGGYLDYAFPLAVGRDGPQTVKAIGWNIAEDLQSVPIVENDASEIITVFHP
jgi:hypothetical protein